MARADDDPGRAEAQRLVDSIPYWHHTIEVYPGVVTPGAYDPRGLLPHLQLPNEMSGLRALDVGARDGFFAFELERRAAQVVALDPEDPSQSGFRVAADLLGSRVDYVEDNVYHLSPDAHGQFDIVLFLGVLYHLRHPLLALDRIAAVCSDMLVVESLVGTGDSSESVASFAAGPVHGDPTVWWVPSAHCVLEMLTASGFATREWHKTAQDRAVFVARRTTDANVDLLRQLDASRAWRQMRQ